MTVTIERIGYDGPIYSYTSTRLHQIRFLAVISEGYQGNYDAFMDMCESNLDQLLDQYPTHKELLYHSDCEGVYIPEKFCPDGDLGIYIGNYDRLKRSLKILNEKIISQPELPKDDLVDWGLVKDAFDILFNMVISDQGEKILVFG